MTDPRMATERTSTALTSEQKRRYSRTTMLPEIGEEGQQRLLGSTVTIVGAGALGSVCAMYLAGSGVGRLRLIDFDTIDVSNLQRQLSFTTADCGARKAEACAKRLTGINPEVEVEVVTELLTRANAPELLAGSDLVMEGSDNPSTKYLVTDTAVALGIPYVLGGVAQWQGQVQSWAPGHRSYRDLFPESACEGGYLPCAVGGVLGPLPGVIGSLMACEAIKLLSGAGQPLLDRLLTIDALTMDTAVFGY